MRLVFHCFAACHSPLSGKLGRHTQHDAIRRGEALRAPLGAVEACRRLKEIADDVVCASMPEPFQAVGLWYEQFDQTSDEEVIALLRQGRTNPVRQDDVEATK